MDTRSDGLSGFMSNDLSGGYQTEEAVSRADAIQLDNEDVLSCFREKFVLPQGIYLGGMISVLARENNLSPSEP